MIRLYEYIQSHEGVIGDWSIDSVPKAKLKIKIDALGQQESIQIAIDHEFLVGLEGCHGILKMKIRGNVALRPLACRGPIDKDGEVTFLVQTIERDRKLPKGVCQQARDRRDAVVADPSRRRPITWKPKSSS